VTIWPLRVTRPEVMISSALRREAMPAEARIFWRRVSIGEKRITAISEQITGCGSP